MSEPPNNYIKNYNTFAENLFKLEIPSEPKFNYFLQACEFPAISMSSIPMDFMNNQAYAAGNKVEYSPLSTTFLLDEEFNNYIFIHDWIRAFINERPWQEVVRDVKIIILTNNKIPFMEFSFVMAMPTSISSLSLNTTTSENMTLTFTVDFSYQYFEFKRINTGE